MDLDIPATITALGTFVAAVGALVISVRNGQKADAARERASAAAMHAASAAEAAAASQREIIATKEGVFEVGKQIDGRLTQLLEITRKAALAEGHKAGVAEQKANPT